MDASGVWDKHRQSFGAVASLYEQSRPTYPDAAVDWLVAGGARRVVDLGAGTGKLTRRLAARGLEVTAVEPSEGMRDQLRAVLPPVETLEGAGESLPLADASVDAVLVAQAWHWVDVERASVEVARVLRPGGYLGLVWNRRAKDVDWVAQLDEILPDHAATDMDVRRPPVGAPFTRFEHFETRWESPLTPQGLVDLIASRSYVIVAPPQEREQILSDVRQLTEEHPDLAGRAEFGMPYVTYCTRAYVQ